MSRPTGSLPASYFERLYAEDRDPWSFATSGYERAKYRATLDALPRPTYRCALEIGCSIGVLTRELATRCERLLALDVAEAALAQARTRCADLDHLRFQRAAVPHDFPAGRFDLILISEVGYYLSRPDLERLLELTLAALEPAGHLLLVHWRPYVADYPLTGDQVHDLVGTRAGTALHPRHRQLHHLYRLDLLERA